MLRLIHLDKVERVSRGAKRSTVTKMIDRTQFKVTIGCFNILPGGISSNCTKSSKVNSTVCMLIIMILLLNMTIPNMKLKINSRTSYREDTSPWTSYQADSAQVSGHAEPVTVQTHWGTVIQYMTSHKEVPSSTTSHREGIGQATSRAGPANDKSQDLCAAQNVTICTV